MVMAPVLLIDWRDVYYLRSEHHAALTLFVCAGNRHAVREKRLTLVFSCLRSWLEFLPRLVWIKLRHGMRQSRGVGP